ncbi:hypothetical protein MMC27_003213 [Xylographa pallens]|nr:hypothetical protein [Xylographa pallens]
MDHLDIPPSCQPNAMTVPFLGLAPVYDRKGFEGFPERHGFDKDKLLSLRKSSGETWIDGKVYASAWVESFLQEWLWFGMLHEFELFCGLEMNRDDYIRSDYTGKESSRIINTTPLFPYLRAVVIDHLIRRGVPLDLQVGDWVNVKVSEQKDLTSVKRYGPFEVYESLGNLEYIIGAAETMPVNVLLLERAMDDKNFSNTSMPANEITKIPLQVLSQALAMSRLLTPKLRRIEPSGGDPLNLLLTEEPDPERFLSCLQEVHRITNILLTYNESADEEPAVRLEVAVSIDILCSSLDNASDCFMKKPEDNRTLGTVSNTYAGSFRKMMQSRNWCLARVAEFGGDFISFYVLSLLPSYESFSHWNCDAIRCLERVKELELLSYEHRPTCDGKCCKVVFDEQQLIDILHEGGIAGVRSIRDHSGAIGYQVIDVTNKRYIAISHVWSHGLGNPVENALPICQIEHLFRLVTAIGGDDVHLWIDTISVPIEPEYKRIAISRLRKVYTEARWVLVIDRHLEQVGSHWLEMQLQLLASEWLKRLWTLQEMRLASDLLIQFNHRAISVAELLGTQLHDQDLFSKVQKELRDRITTRFTKQQDPKQDFRHLMLDLSHRSVTVPSDEAICIATLLGLALEDFHPIPTMVDIYRSSMTLPIEILFAGGTRLKDPGLRWAPSTLLEHPIYDYNFYGDKYATLIPTGLLLCADCIFFDQDFDLKLIDRINGDLYCVCCTGGVKFGVLNTDLDVMSEFRHFQSAALLIGGNLRDSRQYLWKAVLISDLAEEAGVFSGHFRTHLEVVSEACFAEKGDVRFMPSLSSMTRHHVNGSFRLQQAFCVD